METKQEELLYQIGITLIPGIGSITAKKLISYCGGTEAVFKERKAALLKIPGVGESLAKVIMEQDVLGQAEDEVKFVLKNKIEPLFFLDKNYPNRLKHCMDSPVLLYWKGKADLNQQQIISVVGTRKATDRGKALTEKIIEDLRNLDVLVVSGLAYGIDITAHRAALKNDLETVGVLAHGLDKIYPQVHRKTAQEMVSQGGLLTEFMQETKPDRENFPKRNRIIAGMADATLVVEAGIKGGALITAELANSYSRDVFAIPGRVDDKFSEGCNWLISRTKAALVTSAKEIKYMMNWETEKESKKKPVQKQLFVDLTEDQKVVVNLLREKKEMSIDELCLQSKMNTSKVASMLLDLEFSGVVAALPGKVYRLL
jgi:DNA processing protein